MNTLKTTILLAALFGLFLLIGRWLGGVQGMWLGFGFALIMNLLAYWFSDKAALAMSRAQEVSPNQAPGLYRMVGDLARRAGLPMPRVYVIPSAQPNAFATGRDPQHAAVAVTQGLLQALPPAELEGVLAHELAHVKNRDILISSMAATLGGAISFLAQIARFHALFGGYGGGREDDRGESPLALLVGAIVAPIAATLIQLAVSRTREFDADRGSAQITSNPLGLASALRRIEHAAERAPMPVNPSAAHLFIINPLGGEALEGLASLFRTHPRTAERVARLEAMAQEMHGVGHSAYRAVV